jgi:5-methylcytosine-specific restriction endonuclease McrA
MATNPRQKNSTLRAKVVRRVKREEHLCWLCGEPVDKSLPHGLPESPEIDEIIPVSRGGSPFDRSNCHLSHRICNQRRGNKMPYEITRSEQLVTSEEY